MNEIERLELFVEKSDWLCKSRFFQHIQEHSFSSNQLPDEDDLRSFLVTFRLFISNDEPIYLHKIYNRLEESLLDDFLKGELRKSRKHLKEVTQSVGINISQKEAVPRKRGQLPDVVFSNPMSFNKSESHSAEDILDFWINGEYFHTDPNKRKELKRVNIGLGAVITKMVMLQLVYETTCCIFHVAAVIRTALQNKKLSFMAVSLPKV